MVTSKLDRDILKLFYILNLRVNSIIIGHSVIVWILFVEVSILFK